MADPHAHHITTTTSPSAYLLRCSCGWSIREPRYGDPGARATRIGRAIARHVREDDPREVAGHV